MADIELVIKIPEEMYKVSQILDVKYEDTVQIPLEVIANGTPLEEELEKIKAEIGLLQSKYKYNSETEYYKVGRSEAHEEDLEIIDNRIKELKGENNETG